MQKAELEKKKAIVEQTKVDGKTELAKADAVAQAEQKEVNDNAIKLAAESKKKQDEFVADQKRKAELAKVQEATVAAEKQMEEVKAKAAATEANIKAANAKS